MAKSAADSLDGVWMSVSAIARRDGVSKAAISKRLASLPNVSTKENPSDRRELLVNAVEFDRASGETDPSNALRAIGNAQPVGGGEDGGNSSAAQRVYFAQRARREGYAAETARMDFEERVDRLADKQLAGDHSFDVVRRLRDRLSALPAAISERMFAAKDERSMRLLLEDAIRDVLDEAAREFDEVYATAVSNAAA